MKKVLHVLSSLQRSGMERMLLCSYEEWLRHGYRCEVLATADDVGPLAQEMREAGYTVHHLPFRGKAKYLPNQSFIKDYIRLCGQGFDVVHIHVEEASPMFAVLARLAGVDRIVLTPHNTFQFEGMLRRRKYAERMFNRFIGCKYGMISDDVKDCEWERFRNPGVRTTNWLDTSHIRPAEDAERSGARKSLELCPDDFVLLSVGNCNHAKNHSALLEAVKLLATDLAVIHLHVGKEPDDTERKHAARLGINGHVRFLGSQPDPLPFLWAADAFVMPSLNEGLPISAIEAVSAAVPVVCSDAGGLKQLAKDAGGVIVTATDPFAIAEGVLHLASMPVAMRRSAALRDSALIRDYYSVATGVASVVNGLYAPGHALPAILREETSS